MGSIGKSIEKTIKDPTRLITKPVEAMVIDPISKGIEVGGGFLNSDKVQDLVSDSAGFLQSAAGKQGLGVGMSVLTGNPASAMSAIQSTTAQDTAKEAYERKAPTVSSTPQIITSGGGGNNNMILMLGGGIAIIMAVFFLTKKG